MHRPRPARGADGEPRATRRRLTTPYSGAPGCLPDGGPLPDGPTPDLEVVERLARDAEPGLTSMGSGRYFGFVIGGTLPSALAAD